MNEKKSALFYLFLFWRCMQQIFPPYLNYLQIIVFDFKTNVGSMNEKSQITLNEFDNKTRSITKHGDANPRDNFTFSELVVNTHP